MDVAKFELCRQLYQLSQWDKTYFVWAVANEGNFSPWLRESVGSSSAYTEYPAYDLGYLLRKLPIGTEIYRLENQYGAARHSIKDSRQLADTPEDAVCRLSIDLIKKGEKL